MRGPCHEPQIGLRPLCRDYGREGHGRRRERAPADAAFPRALLPRPFRRIAAPPRDGGHPPRLGERRRHPVKLLHPPRPFPKVFADLAAQADGPAAPGDASVTPLVATTAGLNFDGIGIGLGGFSPNSAPPDTNGAVGATQYVQWVNTSFAVFAKTTGALVYGPADGNSLWQGFGGPCQDNDDGDPIALYDRKANRWLMTQFSVTAGVFYQCVAVSTSSDATGTYRRFSYQFTAFNDYPKAGVWPDGYYLSFNMFNAAGTAFLGSRACALDRNQMITASGTPGPIQCFQLSSSFGGLLPADQDGATDPPAGSPNYFVAFGTNVLQLWKFHTDWASPTSSTFVGPTNLAVTAFSEACGGGTCIAQPSTTQQLDSLADRLMYRLAYRNFGTHESLVTNHSVTAGGAPSGVRWYELRNPGGTPSLLQQSTFSPDATSRWMGSIAMDQQGNMLLGYSASSSSVRPSVRITGRAASDAPSTMQAETSVIAGVGSQTGGLSRWGDYSAMTVDPVDDCTFWFTTEYLKATGSFNWSTRIASYKFPTCGAAPTPDFSVSCSPSSFTIAQGGSAPSTCTVTSTNGFASAVALACSGLPSGASCTFAPTSVTPPANGSTTSALSLSVAGSTSSGTYPFQVQGTSATLNRSTGLSLSVTSAGGGGGDETAAFDATLQAPRCGAVGRSCDSGASLLLGRAGLGPEPNQPNTIADSCADGTSGTFHSDESNDRLRVSTTDGSASPRARRCASTPPSGPGPRRRRIVWTSTTRPTRRAPTWTFIATLTPTVAGAQTLSATYTLPSRRPPGGARPVPLPGHARAPARPAPTTTATTWSSPSPPPTRRWSSATTSRPTGAGPATRTAPTPRPLGLWERGDPEARPPAVPSSSARPTSGINDLVTGRLAGAAAGANDVDGGVTSIQSPVITLPAAGSLTLSFQYYLAHGSNSSTADFFRVSVVAGATTTQVFQSLGAAGNRNGAWTPVEPQPDRVRRPDRSHPRRGGRRRRGQPGGGGDRRREGHPAVGATPGDGRGAPSDLRLESAAHDCGEGTSGIVESFRMAKGTKFTVGLVQMGMSKRPRRQPGQGLGGRSRRRHRRGRRSSACPSCSGRPTSARPKTTALRPG